MDGSVQFPSAALLGQAMGTSTETGMHLKLSASANTPLLDLIAPVQSVTECCVPHLCCTIETELAKERPGQPHARKPCCACCSSACTYFRRCHTALQVLTGNARREAGRRAFPLNRARLCALDQYLFRLHEGCIACHMACQRQVCALKSSQQHTQSFSHSCWSAGRCKGCCQLSAALCTC